MKFVVTNALNMMDAPLAGETLTVQQRFNRLVEQAVYIEELGYDAIAVGERHGGPFLNSSPPVILSAVAARTSRIRLMTAVTLLSVLDPVRVAEDYATLDQLSSGRLELIIGKGSGDKRQFPLFGITEEEQWDSLAERYALLKRLWNEENVSWEGRFRTPLDNVTTQPRPYQKSIPVWHGSATSTISTDLAAQYGEPIFSANGVHPKEHYKQLIDHYRERWAYYGRDPKEAIVGATGGFLYLANTTEEAIKRFGPYYEAFLAAFTSGKHPSFKNLEDHIENGAILVGSPERVVEKALEYYKAFGHQVINIFVDGISGAEQREQLERFAAEVAPVLRREAPNSLWG
jgi:alkanesulfonate monooxygenase SsuD/methylene tetrahydromethanopterin reductase-like flavin-dependent oxidoreductase (luciferase family)